MTFFDILTSVVALLAIVAGWRKGLVKQLFAVIGIVAAMVLATSFGERVGELVGLSGKVAMVGGFVALFVLTLIGVSLLGSLLRKTLEAVGVGSLDTIGGIVLSLIKYALLLGVVYMFIDTINDEYHFMSKQMTRASVSFEPLCEATRAMLRWFESLIK